MVYLPRLSAAVLTWGLASAVAGVASAAPVVADEAVEAPPVAIVSGADDEVFVAADGRRLRYFRVHPGGGRLVVRARGPVVLSLRMRAQRPSVATGVLRVKRSETAFSDEAYELERDEAAVLDAGAGAEQNACSSEKVLHLAVPDGVHEYALGAARGAPLLLRILKTATLDPALAIAAEKFVVQEGRYEEPPAPPPPPVIEIPELTVAPAQRERTLEPEEPVASTLDAFVEKAPQAQRLGLVLALRGGAGLTWMNAGVGPQKVVDELQPAWTGALELAWDVTPSFAPFVEGLVSWSSLGSSRAETATLAGTAGLSVATTGDVSVRARLGATFVLSTEQESVDGPTVTAHDDGPGAMAGLGLEIRAGTGRISLEGRWLQRFGTSDWTVPFAQDRGPGPSVLAGYRFEL